MDIEFSSLTKGEIVDILKEMGDSSARQYWTKQKLLEQLSEHSSRNVIQHAGVDALQKLAKKYQLTDLSADKETLRSELCQLLPKSDERKSATDIGLTDVRSLESTESIQTDNESSRVEEISASQAQKLKTMLEGDKSTKLQACVLIETLSPSLISFVRNLSVIVEKNILLDGVRQLFSKDPYLHCWMLGCISQWMDLGITAYKFDFDTDNGRNIPSSFWNMTSVRELNMSGAGLKEVPSGLQAFSHLERMDLSNNAIVTLPTWLGELSNLQEIDVSNNHLSEIPNVIASMTSLKRLQLASNRIRILPNFITNLKHLEVLDMLDNPIVTVPQDLHTLTALKTISLNVDYLPEPILSVSMLKNIPRVQARAELYVDEDTTQEEKDSPIWTDVIIEIPGLTEMPEFLKGKNLYSLVFTEECYIDRIPEWFLDFDLKILDISCAYEGDLDFLGHFDLEELSLGYCSIEDLYSISGASLKSLNVTVSVEPREFDDRRVWALLHEGNYGCGESLMSAFCAVYFPNTDVSWSLG